MSYYLSFPSLILMLFVADKKKTEMNGHGGSDSDSDRPKKKKGPCEREAERQGQAIMSLRLFVLPLLRASN